MMKEESAASSLVRRLAQPRRKFSARFLHLIRLREHRLFGNDLNALRRYIDSLLALPTTETFPHE